MHFDTCPANITAEKSSSSQKKSRIYNMYNFQAVLLRAIEMSGSSALTHFNSQRDGQVNPLLVSKHLGNGIKLNGLLWI